MQRTIPALAAACCALALLPLTLASGESNPTDQPATGSCSPLKTVYSEKRWREAHPARGHHVCPAERRAGARHTIEHFKLYRRYRQITPYRCQPGREGTWAIPCYVIECESHFDWGAYNPSGAKGAYQIMASVPYPARTFKQRLVNHEVAASYSLSAWVCAG